MKFNCGPTYEEKQAAAKRERERLAEWHDYFAWIPRQVASGGCRWLEWIERKGYHTPTHCHKGEIWGGVFVAQYRAKGGQG